MQTVERSAIVSFAPAQMYSLVIDVARYPEFLPWCAGARVEQAGAGEQVAAIKVARGALRTEFTTRNTLKPDAEILMRLVDGPFKRLEGQWNFDAIGECGSRVRFKVEFEFKSRLMGAALGSAFASICDSVVDAFVLRARKVYG
ncbi:MAG TPA: type II toxin-antitoxin system RatA family toxin [Steroidobacteraceae bacterium]|nr:type II toxin-antitoxin system RatA family toxin [Steroidobacteraceae bacterium]